MRLGGEYAENERHLLRNFQKYSRRDVVERESIWNWLAVAQHHGLPTRLLDWTASPYAALHFATANTDKSDMDGVVWAVNFDEVHKLLPAILRKSLEDRGAHLFTVEMLSGSLDQLQQLEDLQEPEFMFFLEPPSIDDRIVNQHAVFSITSRASTSPHDWLHARPDVVKKMVISKELKWEVRDKLDQANITERVLFPGLDGLCSWLRRYYSPRV
jgi:hypothetical protein